MPTKILLTRSYAKVGDIIMVKWLDPGTSYPSVSIAIVTMQEWFKDPGDSKWKWRYFVRFTEQPDDHDHWPTDPRSKEYLEDQIMANLTIGKTWSSDIEEP